MSGAQGVLGVEGGEVDREWTRVNVAGNMEGSLGRRSEGVARAK